MKHSDTLRRRLLVGSVLGTISVASAYAGSGTVQYVPGEMIVKLKRGVSKSLFYQKSNGFELNREIKLGRDSLYVVKYNPYQKNVNMVAKNLNDMPEVEYAEPNFIYRLIRPVRSLDLPQLKYTKNDIPQYTPNDPEFSKLWGLRNSGNNDPGGGAGVAGADINALRAWGLARGSKRIKIAVIDTGVDYNHPDLRNNIWTNYAELNGQPGVDDDGNGYVDDVHGYDFANDDGDPMDGNGHGTHCSGTIAAVHHNNLGVAGVMEHASIIGLKFLTDSGSGTSEAALKAIDYATKMNVDIMSNSWGGGPYSQALKEAIERARDKGIIFVAAAGNSATNNDNRPHYPSNYEVENVVSVAAHTAADGLASFSCYGKSTVDIAAPGHNILSTVPGGGYKSFSGTSMATPHVSGVLGLLLSFENRRLPFRELHQRLHLTSVPSPAYRRTIKYGGRIDAFNLLTNTYPERNEPDPSLWQRFSLDNQDIFESEHPYQDGAEMTKTLHFPGAKFVRLVIDQMETESRYDYISVTDKAGTEADKLSGKYKNHVTNYLEGDTVHLRFKADHSKNGWGFIIREVEIIR